MSILIKMEMPKNCCECIISQTHALNNEIVYQCPFTGYFNSRVVTSQRRMNGCPLIELPPHGRLIEDTVLDAMSMWNTDREYDRGWDSAVQVAKNRIKTAPTIIEAEDSHKCYHADGDCIHDNCETCPKLCEVNEDE